MKRIPRMLFVGGCLFASFVGAGFLLYRSIPDLCGNDVGKELLSPDGEWKAVVFERDCGATTDFSTQISVLKGDQSLPHGSSGNVFIADGDHGKVGVDVKGIMPLDLNWESSNQLLIRYPARARIFSRVPRYKGVHLRYVPDESLN